MEVLLSVTCLRHEGAEYAGSLMLVTDISRMREYEEALRRAQVQMIQHEKMAALGTMVAGVAHELNNPTHFIQLSAKSLEKDLHGFKGELAELLGEDDAEFIAYLERNFTAFDDALRPVLEGCGRIHAIVQDLRLFSRLGESGKKEADIAESLELALRMIRTGHRDIDFATDLHASRRIVCSPAEINQAFLNIMANACQAIEEKRHALGAGFQGRLEIRLQDDAQGVCAIFADNGCGMPEAVKARVYEPFFTTRSVGRGVGLGLSVVYQVIQDHGGRIEVDSMPGEGTTLRIFLPSGDGRTEPEASLRII